MTKQKSLSWLYEQLPILVEKGIVPSEVANRIKNHYGPVQNVPSYNWAFLIIGILGAVLIGGGIILIFAYNWDSLSRFWRTVLSFMPLIVAQLIYGYVFFRKSDSDAWVEGASAFLMLMLASSIALISQTYNIGGSMGSFLFTWMLLSIPLMYLMNASLPTLFYLTGIASWAAHTTGSISVYYWLFLLAAVPHLYKNIDPDDKSIRSQLLGWGFILTLAFAYFNVVEGRFAEYYLIGPALFLTLFYLLGQYFYPLGNRFMQRPFRSFAIGGIFIMLLILSFEWPDWGVKEHNWISGYRYDAWAAYTNVGVLIAAAAGIVFLGIKQLQSKVAVNPFILGFPIFVLAGYFLSGQSALSEVLANLYLFTFGGYYIYQGVQKHQIGLINLGMLFISSIIISRFFDADWGLAIKGVVFILLGIGFLFVNLILAKRLKEKPVE